MVGEVGQGKVFLGKGLQEQRLRDWNLCVLQGQ
jgi:hypothetical protein